MTGLTPAQQSFLLRAATVSGHAGMSAEQILDVLDRRLAPVIAAKGKGNDAKGGFAVARGLARTVREIEERVSRYVQAEDLRQGEPGLFDSRSLGCWLALAERAAIPFVPATRLLTIPEPVLELIASPELVEQAPSQPGPVMRLLDGLSGGALGRAFDRNDGLPVEAKREIHALGLAMLADAGNRIPMGYMVRHDHMGPGTLKAWAGIGWEPHDGDEGVRLEDDGRSITLGPGWLMAGNQRYVDVTDARTIQAIACAMTFQHTFWARPWMAPARRIPGLDPHRPADWPDDMRRGDWPAEWRVFIQGGRVVGCAAYYGWAELAGDAHDLSMAELAMDYAQCLADAAAKQGAIPDEPQLARLRRRSAEIRTNLPDGTVCCALDFVETASGLMLLEGAPPYCPGGFGAHPCASAGQRWPSGICFRTAEGIDLADLATWGPEALSPPK